MGNEQLIKKGFEYAQETYAALGVDVLAAMDKADAIPVSMHCWQGDDVTGFDGSDSLTGGIAVTGFGSDPARTGLLLDIGTNCEMALAVRGKLLIASAAAGPAFEGSSSAVGCRARPGAADRLAVSESGHFRFRVIGGDPRKLDGICGSGLVDFLAGMRRAGLAAGAGTAGGMSALSGRRRSCGR